MIKGKFNLPSLAMPCLIVTRNNKGEAPHYPRLLAAFYKMQEIRCQYPFNLATGLRPGWVSLPQYELLWYTFLYCTWYQDVPDNFAEYLNNPVTYTVSIFLQQINIFIP